MNTVSTVAGMDMTPPGAMIGESQRENIIDWNAWEKVSSCKKVNFEITNPFPPKIYLVGYRESYFDRKLVDAVSEHEFASKSIKVKRIL